MKIVTQADKIEINRLYKELGTYAAVSRATGFSPSTVKKYVVADFVPETSRPIVKFDGKLPEFEPERFAHMDWNKACELTDEEYEEVRALWEELDV